MQYKVEWVQNRHWQSLIVDDPAYAVTIIETTLEKLYPGQWKRNGTLPQWSSTAPNAGWDVRVLAVLSKKPSRREALEAKIDELAEELYRVTQELKNLRD